MVFRGSVDDELRALHNRLDDHFGGLRDSRASIGAPVFALEHGLAPTEFTFLSELVVSAVGVGHVPSDAWLPLVVYATEFGYSFSGNEYWQTFESRTPGWIESGDRLRIRQRFREFKERFAGAVPRGAWAEHFSIICWPITNAILPIDLQRQLARSLFESRQELSTDLLEDPSSLGQMLSARRWRYSGRYQALAEDADLLGLIASALLAEHEGSSPYLTKPVLERLVTDLERERQAKTWLSGARSAAHKVRLSGLQVDLGKTLGGANQLTKRSIQSIAPRLSLKSRGDEWQPFIEIPDLSPLVAVNSDLGDEIARCRLVVGGADQPEPTGTLGMPGLDVRLRLWPRTGKTLFELEGATMETNSTLAEECSLSGGPPWLFRIGSEGTGTEVRGRAVLPGKRYLVVLEAQPVAPRPSWIATAPLRADGVSAWLLNCPSSFGAEELSALRGFDLGAITEIRVEPTGTTAPSWDGSGRAEWLVGEAPMFRVGLTAPARKVVCRVADEEVQFEPTRSLNGAEVLLTFPDLEVGDHVVSILTVQDGEEPREAGRLELRIRRPLTRPSAGGPREGMAMIATPANPTLEEMWSARAHLEIQGPEGVKAKLFLKLLDPVGRLLATGRRTVRLPVRQSDWQGILDAGFRHDANIKRRYQDASACQIVASHPQLGEVELECFRRFSPVALFPASDHGAEFLRLINNTGESVTLRQWEFSHPDLSSPLAPSSDSTLEIEKGGLVVAEAGSSNAAAIVLPLSNFTRFQSLAGNPHLKERPRTVDSLESLARLANRWEEADLPPNPVAAAHEQAKVLAAIGQEVWGLIGGPRWRSVERKFRREDEKFNVTDLLGAVGRKDREQAFARGLRAELNTLERPSNSERVRCLAQMLAKHGDKVGVKRHRIGLAAEVLEVARVPGRIAGSERHGTTSMLQALLDRPGLLRAVRFVLLTEPDPSEESEQSGSLA
jgi:hypothetical protein